jgi:hypothetical protein
LRAERFHGAATIGIWRLSSSNWVISSGDRFPGSSPKRSQLQPEAGPFAVNVTVVPSRRVRIAHVPA